VQALGTLGEYHSDNCTVELPTGSGNHVCLKTVSNDLANRLVSIFSKDENGNRPVHADHSLYSHDKHFKDLILFYEYFHGDTTRGVGASHQTGWTGVVAELINRVSSFEKVSKKRMEPAEV
jgi:hypothetical protein